MPKCSRCGAETQLYVGESPLCEVCDAKYERQQCEPPNLHLLTEKLIVFSTGHPPEPIMNRYLHSLASKEEHDLVEEHLIDCSDCCKRVAEFARSLASGADVTD
jgi:hypothetical protein